VLGTATRAGEIHQDMPHQLSGDTEEKGAVPPPHLPQINQTRIGFVDQRGGLQGMASHVNVWRYCRLASARRNSVCVHALKSGLPVSYDA